MKFKLVKITFNAGNFIHRKSFTDPETIVFQAANRENLVIVFILSTRVTDGQTKLKWLRRAIARDALRISS